VNGDVRSNGIHLRVTLSRVLIVNTAIGSRKPKQGLNLECRLHRIEKGSFTEWRRARSNMVQYPS
jgi:hypothetical protein